MDAIGRDPVTFSVNAPYAIRASPAPTGSIGFSVNESKEIMFGSSSISDLDKPINPFSPNFRIKFLHFDNLYNFPAKGPIVESWSARENLASRSLGVIKSNPMKSEIFPHLLAT